MIGGKGLGIAVIPFILWVGVVWGEEWRIRPSLPSDPSIERGYAMCYDIRTFALLNCHFTYVLEKGLYSGGHEHNSGRPIGGLRFAGDSGGGTDTISFNSAGGVINLEYVVPEVSGEVELTITSIPPSPYRCVSSCYEERVASIKIGGLQPMPESGIGAWRLTGSYGQPGVASKHVENHYGTPSTKARIAAMATDYFEDTGVAIGVNDMSLPWGGLFDIENNWSSDPGHLLHRVGKSVDVDHLGVKEKKLNEIGKKYGCKRREVDRIHYECP